MFYLLRNHLGFFFHCPFLSFSKDIYDPTSISLVFVSVGSRSQLGSLNDASNPTRNYLFSGLISNYLLVFSWSIFRTIVLDAILINHYNHYQWTTSFSTFSLQLYFIIYFLFFVISFLSFWKSFIVILAWGCHKEFIDWQP